MSTTTTTREIPMIFSSPMVRAILDNRKCMTRRVVKPQPSHEFNTDPPIYVERYGVWTHPCGHLSDLMFDEPGQQIWRCPYGKPGDLLWVRETWQWLYNGVIGDYNEAVFQSPTECFYRADESDPETRPSRWRSPIHMPRWASRITLRVKEVRVERLQSIGEEDAQAEGVKLMEMVRGHQVYHASHRAAFVSLWDSINGKKPGCSWSDNPFVWAIRFERCEQKGQGER